MGGRSGRNIGLLATMSPALKLPLPSPLRAGSTNAIERYVDESHCILWFDNVEIILSRKPPSREVMQRIVLELVELSRKCACGTGALLVIRSDVSPPDEEARAYIRKELGRAPMLAAAQVVMGKGFVGAAMRSVLSLIQLLGRPRYPMKVFGEVGPASAWLVKELRARAHHAPDEHRLAFAVSERYDLFLQ
jgi:hypothetical protein